MLKYSMADRVASSARRFWLQSATARDVSKVYAGDVLSRVLGVVTAVVLIRELSVTDYANYVAFGAIAAFSASLVGTGINLALVRFSAEHISRNHSRPVPLYGFALVLEIGIYLLFLAICFLFPTQVSSLLLGQPASTLVVQLGVLCGFGLLLLELGRSIYQAEERFTYFIVALWIRYGLMLAIVMLLWLTRGLTFQAAALSTAVLSVMIGVGVLHRASGAMGVAWQELFRGNGDLLRRFVTSSGWLMVYFVTLAAFAQMDIFMLSRLRPEAEVAIYGVARQYYAIGLLLLSSINAVLLPKFSRVEMQSPDRQKAFLVRWLRYSIWAALPILVFDLVGKPLFVWVNGIQYERSFAVFVVFSVGIWLSLVLSPLTNILVGRGDFRFLAMMGMCALAINVLTNNLLISAWGAIGGAIATVLAHNVVLQLPILWRVWK